MSVGIAEDQHLGIPRTMLDGMDQIVHLLTACRCRTCDENSCMKLRENLCCGIGR